jgi:hypothetical protein
MSAPTGDLAFGTSMLGEAHVDVAPKPAGSVLARLDTATTAVFDACSRQGSAGPWAAWARGTVFAAGECRRAHEQVAQCPERRPACSTGVSRRRHYALRSYRWCRQRHAGAEGVGTDTLPVPL